MQCEDIFSTRVISTHSRYLDLSQVYRCSGAGAHTSTCTEGHMREHRCTDRPLQVRPQDSEVPGGLPTGGFGPSLVYTQGTVKKGLGRGRLL